MRIKGSNTGLFRKGNNKSIAFQHPAYFVAPGKQCGKWAGSVGDRDKPPNPELTIILWGLWEGRAML